MKFGGVSKGIAFGDSFFLLPLMQVYPRVCGAVCPTPRVKGACASTLNKPAQKLFIKVLQNAGVRIPELVAVII